MQPRTFRHRDQAWSAFPAAISMATAIAAAVPGRTILIRAVAIVGAAGVGRVVAVVVIPVPVVAMAAGIAIPTAGTIVVLAIADIAARACVARSGSSTGAAAIINRPTNAARVAGAARAAGAAGCRGAAFSDGSAAARTHTAADSSGVASSGSTADGTGCAKGRALRALEVDRSVVDGAGHGITLIPNTIRSAKCLGPNGTATGFLTLHNVKSAVAVHGGIGDCRHTLLAGPDALSIGRRSKCEEEGGAGQSKSV
jgi:hypothetical protein